MIPILAPQFDARGSGTRKSLIKAVHKAAAIV
jgi:hypothetical protein